MGAESDFTGIKLLSNRLALRAFTPADAPEIFTAVSPTITRFMSWDPSPSPAAFAEVWRQWLPRMTAGTDLSLVIRLRATDEFLGVAGVHRIGSAEPDAGIWLKEPAHRLGYGREAIGAIVQMGPRAYRRRGFDLSGRQTKSSKPPPRRKPARRHRRRA